MTTRIAPLYSTVSELHDDLVKRALDALEVTLASDQRPIRASDVFNSELRAHFARDAKERMAQVAGAVWMEAECDREDAYRAGIEFVLKMLEAGPPREVELGARAASAAVTAILRGTAMGIRETITRDMVRELAKRLR